MQNRGLHWLLLLALIGLVAFSSMYVGQAQADTILSLVNAERSRVGVLPLVSSEQLRLAAQRHSEDMAAGDFLSHTGSDGSEFWQRIAATGYNMMTGAENVLYRWDADASGAFEQWRNSPGHYNNMVNGAYAEVGIAFALAPSGRYYFTMLLASRPDFSAPAPTNVPPTQMPASPPVEPTIVASIVPGSPSQTAQPTGIPSLVLQPQSTNVPIQQPSSIPLTATLIQPPLMSQTPLPTVMPMASTVAPTLVVDLPPASDRGRADESNRTSFVQWSFDVAVEAVYRMRAKIAEDQPAFGAIEIPVEVRLIIDGNSFSLINISGGALFLDGLTFASTSGEMSIDSWRTEYLSADLEVFPRRGCLQAWTLNTGEVLDPPADCQSRYAWIAVGSQYAFWRGVETFTVLRYGEPVTVCSTYFQVCDFSLDQRITLNDLPDNNVTDIPTLNAVTRPRTTGQSDIMLLYSSDSSFTLINVSGASLNLRGLGFSGPGGNLPIGAWDIDALSRPLDAFPRLGCLQAWSLGQESPQSPPDQCAIRHAWIAVNDTQAFWKNADVFTVSYNGSVVTTCRVSAGQCDFDLPE